MAKIVDFETARHNKEHERKEAKVKDIQSSFKTARESSQSKSKSAEKLLKMFRGKKPKAPKQNKP